MTHSHSRPGFGRRSLTALPFLLVPLLLTACSGPGGSPNPSSAEGSGSTTSSASASTSGAGGGADLYEKYKTSAQFCGLVPLTDVSTAMQVKPTYPAPKLNSPDVECSYDGGSISSIVSVLWSPKGDGQLDNYLKASPKDKAVAIDVGGHAGRSLSGDVQVEVGDAAIDVIGLENANTAHEAALAAAFLKKVG